MIATRADGTQFGDTDGDRAQGAPQLDYTTGDQHNNEAQFGATAGDTRDKSHVTLHTIHDDNTQLGDTASDTRCDITRLGDPAWRDPRIQQFGKTGLVPQLVVQVATPRNSTRL